MLLASPVRSAAGLNDWTAVGPEGGSINRIAIDPSTPTTLYAATEGGVLKSTDAGATWATTNAGLTSLPVTRIVVDPTAPATLYTASFVGGVFKSTDGGATWTAKNVGIGSFMQVLAIDPTNPAILYGKGPVGIVKTTNGATTWAASNVGLPFALNVTGIAVDPFTPGTVYVASPGNGVYKSGDAGATWAASNAALTDLDVFALALDPLVPGTLYAGTCGGSPAQGVYKSADGGGTWALANVGLDPLPCIGALTVDPTTPGVVYVETLDGGAFKSVDGGATWLPRNVGIEGRDVVDFAIDPSTSPTVYAASVGGGVFKTTDGGATWAAANAGVRAYDVQAVAFDPATPGTIYLGMFSDDPGETLFRSTDGGATWARRGPELADPVFFTEFGVGSIAIDPTHSATIYAGSDSGVFKTTDGGVTWTDPPSFGFVRAVVVDPDSPSIVYAGTFDRGVLKSTDHGASWAETNSGLASTSIGGLVMDPKRSKILYTGTDAGVFRTTDGGATWTPRTQGIGTVSVIALAIDPTDGDVLYAGTDTSPPRLFKSTDGGLNWADHGNFERLAAIVVDPLHPGTVYAAGSGGVLKSVDGGDTWASLNAGLPNGAVDALALDPQHGVQVYAGTPGSGAFTTQTLCLAAADCNEADLCIIDTCAPGDQAADDRGCVSQPVECDAQCHTQSGFCDSGTGLCVYTSPSLADGTPCDDDDPCTFDRCIAGVCSGNPTPQIGCLIAPASRVLLKDSAVDSKNILSWKWAKGFVNLPSFADPVGSGTRYTLCVYDHSAPGGGASLILRAAAPAGGTCGGLPCWAVKGGAYKYRDRSAAADGLTGIVLKPGFGNAKITVKGKGVNLPFPSLPLVPGVVVQLAKTHGLSGNACWESDFTSAILRNDTREFQAR